MKLGIIYILSNERNTTIYIGVTSKLVKRGAQHKLGQGSIFTSKYNLSKLIHYGVYDDIKEAITREKQLKNWKIEWKKDLINSHNPQWYDLYNEIL